ncbi:hypothetical protein [Acaricomes phytoseiuli]|nr:hypothetical protein [Acaricomes phytoseiuli]
MNRPRDWSPLGSSDPCPGDPERVWVARGRWQETASIFYGARGAIESVQLNGSGETIQGLRDTLSRCSLVLGRLQEQAMQFCEVQLR